MRYPVVRNLNWRKATRVCGNEFERYSTNQIYCSPTCRQKQTNDRFLVFQRDKFRCFYCGRSSFEHNVELRVDHLRPITQSGQNKAGNVVTACVECNLKKYDSVLTTLDEMLAEVRRRNEAAGIPNDRKLRLFR